LNRLFIHEGCMHVGKFDKRISIMNFEPWICNLELISRVSECQVLVSKQWKEDQQLKAKWESSVPLHSAKLTFKNRVSYI
jgi:hypothetical protein